MEERPPSHQAASILIPDSGQTITRKTTLLT